MEIVGMNSNRASWVRLIHNCTAWGVSRRALRTAYIKRNEYSKAFYSI